MKPSVRLSALEALRIGPAAAAVVSLAWGGAGILGGVGDRRTHEQSSNS
jgi:hypothetical protein